MLLADQQTNCGTPRQPPVLANKLQLRLDVIDEEGHVPVEVEIRHLEDQRITEDGHAADPIHLAGAQGANGTRWSPTQLQLLVDTQHLVHLDQLRGRPDLYGLHLVRGLCLNPVRRHHRLQTHRLGNQDNLDDQIGGCSLVINEWI